MPASFQIAPVVLIGRVLDDRIRVQQSVNATGPGEVPIAVTRVVPRRADDGELVVVPPNGTVVPEAHRAFDVDVRERVDQQFGVRIEVDVVAPTRRDRHAPHGVKRTVACWARVTSGPGHTPKTNVTNTPKAMTTPVERGTTTRAASSPSSEYRAIAQRR